MALDTGSVIGMAGMTERRMRDVWVVRRCRVAEVVGMKGDAHPTHIPPRRVRNALFAHRYHPNNAANAMTLGTGLAAGYGGHHQTSDA